MRHFTIFWRSGEAQVVTGYDEPDAFRRAGIGAGALPAVDFYEKGDVRRKWLWDSLKKSWGKNPDFVEPEQIPAPVIEIPLTATSKIEAKLMQTKEGIQLDIRKFVAPDGPDTWIPTVKGLRVSKSVIHDLIVGLQQIEEAM